MPRLKFRPEGGRHQMRERALSLDLGEDPKTEVRLVRVMDAELSGGVVPGISCRAPYVCDVDCSSHALLGCERIDVGAAKLAQAIHALVGSTAQSGVSKERDRLAEVVAGSVVGEVQCGPLRPARARAGVEVGLTGGALSRDLAVEGAHQGVVPVECDRLAEVVAGSWARVEQFGLLRPAGPGAPEEIRRTSASLPDDVSLACPDQRGATEERYRAPETVSAVRVAGLEFGLLRPSRTRAGVERNLSSRMRRSSLVFSEQPPLCRAC
jgi:hypothetical protein